MVGFAVGMTLLIDVAGSVRLRGLILSMVGMDKTMYRLIRGYQGDGKGWQREACHSKRGQKGGHPEAGPLRQGKHHLLNDSTTTL